MQLSIDDQSINDLVREGLRKAIDLAQQAHYTDLIIRVNGEDLRVQADWLKYLRIEE